MRKLRLSAMLLAACALGVFFLLLRKKAAAPPEATAPPPRTMSPVEDRPAAGPGSSEILLEGYADPGLPPIEDLRKLHRLITAYFSVVKDPVRNPIGGNADLAAALKGANANRQVFVAEGHPVFSAEGLLLDRWGTPLVVHPEAWRQLELRSAGPDKTAYTDDDLILTPKGTQAR